ncbi:MAG: hypothetical protein ACRBB4_15840 [Neptuniibacter sp.]
MKKSRYTDSQIMAFLIQPSVQIKKPRFVSEAVLFGAPKGQYFEPRKRTFRGMETE